MSKKITVRNIFWYLQGHTRYRLCNTPILKYIVPKYLRDQISIRENSVHEICQSIGTCKECGCNLPQLQYADKECYGWCYPPMLNRSEFTLLQNGGCHEDEITNLTWRIQNGKFYYNDITR